MKRHVCYYIDKQLKANTKKMKKIKFAIAATCGILGFGGALAFVTSNANGSQRLNASSIFNSTIPNIDLSQKGITWDCISVTPTACYYILNPNTHRYTVPSETRGTIIFF